MGNNIPTVSNIPRDMQQFCMRVREALDGDGLDSAVTARQLIAAGLADVTKTGTVTTPGGTIDTPRPPTNITAAGALASIVVSWEGPAYAGHAYT